MITIEHTFSIFCRFAHRRHRHCCTARVTQMLRRNLASPLLSPAGSKQSGAVAERLPPQDCIVAIEVDPTLEEAFLLQRSSARMVRFSI